jgi:signal transduction histidine kinase
VTAHARLLLVDDNESNCLTLSALLEDEGFAVATATSGREALDQLDAVDPHVVVCDLHMPDLDGFGVLHGVRTRDPGLPVVILSGDGEAAAVIRAVRQGAFDYVVKSGNMLDALLVSARRAAAHCRVVRENARLAAELREANAELERRNAALAAARDQALAGSRAKSAFLANMSHEFRTPLNAIIGYAGLVQETLQDRGLDDADQDLARIVTAGTHLLGLIADVLDLATIEAGRLSIEVEPFDPVALAAQALETVEPLAHRNRNTLHLGSSAPGEPVVTDPRRVRQILLNLLGNACKFTSAGRIEVEVRRNADRVEFTVRDTGIGLSPEQQALVFEEFVQVHPSVGARFGGTGLGLSISQRLCHLLGGRIDLRSALGQGSTFTVSLPARWSGSPAPRSETAEVR